MAATTAAASRSWRHSQHKWDVKLLLVEDAESSQQELPQLLLLDTRVVLERKRGEFGRAAVSTGVVTDTQSLTVVYFSISIPTDEIGVFGNTSGTNVTVARLSSYRTPKWQV